LDYAALPPEINSARIYAGPGSAALLAAAAAWGKLAAELHAAAVCYQSVLSALVHGSWLGPASACMAAAAAPYAAWMSATATQCDRIAAQSNAAASAFQTAYAMTVPPPVIAANRALLSSLTATNILGQNTPAIAATEAHYAQMWAQDAAAMYRYAADSAAATTVAPLAAPPQVTNPAGPAGQAAAVAQNVGASAGTRVQATLSQLTSAIPIALREAASPTSSTPYLLPKLQEMLETMTFDPHFWARSGSTITSVISTAKSLMPAAKAAESGAKAAGSALAGGLGSAGLAVPGRSLGSAGLAGLGPSLVSADLGRAPSIGTLSVPQAWTAAAPATTSGAAALSGGGLNWVAPAGASETGSMLGGVPMTGMAGRSVGAAVLKDGLRRFVMPRPPAAG